MQEGPNVRGSIIDNVVHVVRGTSWFGLHAFHVEKAHGAFSTKLPGIFLIMAVWSRTVVLGALAPCPCNSERCVDFGADLLGLFGRYRRIRRFVVLGVLPIPNLACVGPDQICVGQACGFAQGVCGVTPIIRRERMPFVSVCWMIVLGNSVITIEQCKRISPSSFTAQCRLSTPAWGRHAAP